MDKETFLNMIKEIGTCEDEVDRRTMLTKISDEVIKIYDSNELLEKEKSDLVDTNKKQADDMEKLRSANMQLFLKVGSNKTQEQIIEDKTGIKEEPEVEPRKFETLFDEKGNLK